MKKYKIGLALLCRFKGCWLFLLTGDGGVFLFVSDIGKEKNYICKHQKYY